MFPQASTTLNATTLGILAGGRGSRLAGRDKGLLAIHGEPLVGALVATSGDTFAQVIISCNRSPWFYSHYGERIVGDLHRNPGPVGGVMALVAACETPALLILPCDLNIVASDVLQRLEPDAQRHGAAYLVDQEGLHNGCLLVDTRGLHTLKELGWEILLKGGLHTLFTRIGAIAVAAEDWAGGDIDDLDDAVRLALKSRREAGSV